MGKKTAEKRRKRLKFFDLGNTRCPICLRSFTRDAAEKGQTVTLEHVPPETLGGSVKCLTCKPCNNSAGRKLDRAAERMNRAIMDRKAGLGRKVVVNACGSQETGYLSMDGGLDPEAIRRLPGSSDAKQQREKSLQQQHGQEIALWVEATRRPSSKWDVNKGFTISMPKEPPGNYVMVSWLRSAYLLVFSLLGPAGYQYAESEAIRPIREQIMKPDEELAPPLLWNLSSPSPEDVIGIQNRRQPFCWIVKMGSMVVLLPRGGPAAHYREVVELADQIKTVKDFRGLRCKLPSFGRRHQLSVLEDSAAGQDLFGREFTGSVGGNKPQYVTMRQRGSMPLDEHKERYVIVSQQGAICTCLSDR